MYRRLFALGLSCCLVGLPLAGRMAWGQADTKDEQKKDDDAEPKKDRGRPKNSIKPYDQVITAEAKSTPGLFIVHRIDDKVFFEIPESAVRQGDALGHADREDADGLRLWRQPAGASRGALGDAGRRRPAARHQLHDPRRCQRLDSQRGGVVVAGADHRGVSDPGVSARTRRR